MHVFAFKIEEEQPHAAAFSVPLRKIFTPIRHTTPTWRPAIFSCSSAVPGAETSLQRIEKSSELRRSSLVG